MPKQALQIDTSESERLRAQLKETIAKEKEQAREALKEKKNQKRIREAEEILTQYEDRYNEAKEIFTKVNGARRVLKNRA